MKDRYRRTVLALLLGGLLAAGGSAAENTAGPQVPEASVATVEAPPSPAPTTTEVPPAAAQPLVIETPSFLVGGYDAEHNKITIADLTEQERAVYNNYPSPQAAAKAALDLGCRAVHKVWIHKDELPRDEGGITSNRLQAFDDYNEARSLYDYSQSEAGTLTARYQYKQALGALGCNLPPYTGDVG